MPLISVVLPTYNRAGSLARAIDSVLGQTFTDLELIVVDDASTDTTSALVQGILDRRLKYLRLEQNRGPAGARNAGLAAAAAEAGWIAFQDSDDEWLPDKLAEQWKVASAAPAEVGLVLTGYDVVDPRGVIRIEPRAILAGDDPVTDALDGWPIITPTWLARRALLRDLGGFDESFPCLEDWDLVFRMFARCRVLAVPGPGLRKHAGVNSVFANTARTCDALERILRTHGPRWSGHPLRLARRLAHVGCLQYRLGRRTEARATLGRALLCAPFSASAHLLYWSSWLGPRVLPRVERWLPRFAGMAL